MSRYVAGVMRGLPADTQPGTLLGPKDITRETMVVVGPADDGRGVKLGYATTDEIEAALSQPEPRSVTEARIRRSRPA